MSDRPRDTSELARALNEAERRLRLATQTSADQAAAYEVLMAERDRLAERVAWLQSLFPLLGAAPP